MTSLYWLKPELCCGPDNPDKTFYLIRMKVNGLGLASLITHILRVREMMRQLRPDVIPVVDLGVSGDQNQFAGTSGEDVWSMFLEPLSGTSLQEVYNSRHVILDQSANLKMNPYMAEFYFSSRWTQVHFGDALRYREDVRRHTASVLQNIFPPDARRILAVVVRGTDYTASGVSRLFPRCQSTEQTLQKAVRYVRENGFDHVYLCTEDQASLEMFQNSELQDRLFYVDQKRVDYRKEENRDRMLCDIYKKDPSGSRARSLDYIAVLEGLTRCRALLANVTCGAVSYALGRGTDYEFVDVPKTRR